MPTSFYYVIIVQVVFLGVVMLRTKYVPSFKDVVLSALFGIVIGLFFDIFSSNYKVYTYIAEGGNTLMWTGLTFWQLLVNGVLSFGLSVLTVRGIIKEQTPRVLYPLWYTMLMCVVALGSLFALEVLIVESFVAMCLAGVFIIAVSEIGMVLAKKKSMLFSLLLERKVSPLLTFVALSLSMGVVCEIGNHFFPFWTWLPYASYPRVFVEGAIVTGGYFVLLYPMQVFWVMLQKRIR